MSMMEGEAKTLYLMKEEEDEEEMGGGKVEQKYRFAN